MPSILGNEYRYADSYVSLTNINESIAIKTAQLNEAVRLLDEALDGITLCGNSSWGCVRKSGRHISTWRDQRDKYSPLVDQYKKELNELLAIQKDLAGTQAQTATTTVTVAAAETAVVEAETAQTKADTTKYLLYGGIVVALIIAGIVIFKMIKKSK